MISDSYSTARMWALTKRHCVENRKNIAITLSVIFGLLLLSAIMLTKAFHIERERTAAIIGCFAFAMGIIVQILGSLTFSAMSTKQKRISNLMLPAAQSEKFVSQCLIYIVGGNLSLIVSVVLADTISALVFGMTPGWYMVVNDNMWFMKLANDQHGCQALCMIFLCITWCYLICQSLFVLGSAFWPRKSYLKTFVALLVIQIALPIVLPFSLLEDCISALDRFFSPLNLSVNETIALYWCAIVIAYALLGLIYWFAWRRYRNMAVVKRYMMD